ncbi:hypothetical protein [Flavobacterium sp. PL02]|jgi:hypothetical protein|uniref:hypothetical protein n=1 Tax=Flavobacterium sp. PL02 TaxID=3088354 RepID=UPI002B22DD6B|nr:hypothetical protein [Flavobacterium sp. PL02]MEA9413096.1 hypothetical protein [Flavobacterium sp. PL02]
MDNSRIAILSTVINFDLYSKSSQFFPKNIQKYVIDGRNGMHGLHSIFYMMKKLRNKNIEWLIMADEDVLFQDTKIVFDLIDKMKSEDYMLSGIRDGGIISHRVYNPHVINTFFSILNFKELERIWNRNEIIKNNYILENEFMDDISNLIGSYETTSLYEPYYCFYFWLRRKNKKFLFLDTEMYKDQISNSVFYNEKIFLYHTWFARAYGNSDKHTERIDDLFNLLAFKADEISNPIIFRDKTFFIIQKMKKNYRRVVRKILKIKNLGKK